MKYGVYFTKKKLKKHISLCLSPIAAVKQILMRTQELCTYINMCVCVQVKQTFRNALIV